MKNYLLSLLLLCAAAHLPAQPSVLTGKITDDYGEKVVGATLKVYQGEILVGRNISDVNGTYRIPVEPGTYTLEVMYAGCVTQNIPDIRVRPNTSHELDLRLKFSPDMKRVVVKEYKTPLLDEEHLPPPGKTERVSFDTEEDPPPATGKSTPLNKKHKKSRKTPQVQ
ncbi:MAG: carboxypeptidase regulatory-like domain-containing protein [Saprospiraceae bacterium]|nr:carboxypeptidase regulatory-like domain-containing protein [Saprospiraceae bacterium]